jgi:predicted  nucleic acid-binding Zn-ribbon protein
MPEGPVRHCPGCGQALRFPVGIGGMLMACPECGHRFASPFKLAGQPAAASTVTSGVASATAAAAAESPAPRTPAPPEQEADAASAGAPATKASPGNALAARVAALYAANSR